MKQRKYLHWLALEENKPVSFENLVFLMAKAMHPSDAEEMTCAFARIELEKELKGEVERGALKVLNSLTLGQHPFPHGEALKKSVLIPYDLRPFLESRGIELRLMPHGSGPTYWTLDNAAIAISEQEQWHDGARASLLDAMKEAAERRDLKVRDPHTDLYTTALQIRTYYELVTPADVNAWLENQGAPYRWNLEAPIDDQPHPTTEPAPAEPLQRFAAQEAAILSAIRQAGHEPLALPKNEPGKAGVKSEIRKALNGNRLFLGPTVFDKAWERLQGSGEIATIPRRVSP